jgi:hypothetical protein
MMIGGVAVIAYGVKRLTTDVDAVVQGGSIAAGGESDDGGRSDENDQLEPTQPGACTSGRLHESSLWIR